MVLDHWLFRIAKTVASYFRKRFSSVAKYIRNRAEIESDHRDLVMFDIRYRKDLPHEAIGLYQPQAASHLLSNVRRWRASLNHGNGKCPQDLKRDAAWRRFICCIEALPPDEVALLWEMAFAEAATAHG
jgi:hypothetical protein